MKIEKLVETLSSSERMYFRKFGFRVEKSEDSTLNKLFNELCEDSGIKDFILTKKLNIKNEGKLRFHKNALKERILEVLSPQSLNYSNQKILSYYQQAVWLKERSAMEEAIKRVKKGIRLAEECSQLALLLEGQSLEKKLMRAHNLWVPGDKNEFEESDKRINDTVQHFLETEKYLTTDHKMFSLGGKRGRDITNESFNDELELIIKPLLKNGSPSAENYEAYCLHYLSLSRYYGAKKQVQNKMNSERHLIDFILSKPEKSQHFSATFPTVLNNYLNTCIDLELYEDFDKYFIHFDYSNKKISVRMRARIFLMAANLSLNRYLKQNQLQLAAEKMIHYEVDASGFYGALEPEYFHVFHINAAIVAFGNFQFKNCLRWCHKLLEKGIRSPNRDVIRIVYLLSTCCHFSLGNNSNVKSITSKYLRMYESEELLETEKIIYAFIKNSIQNEKTSANIQTLISGVRKLESILKESEFIDLILLKPWIKSLSVYKH